MGSALVLGGGGVTGIAWTTGLLLGLAEAGVEVTDADLIVGTSAGAAVGAQVATGRDPHELYDLQLEEATSEIAAELDLAVLGPIFEEMRGGERLDREGRARVGHMALEARTVAEPVRRSVIEARLRTDEWPERSLLVTAVDAATGALVVLDRHAGVGLIDAVAASCAVPGVWPPVTAGGRRLIDGGIRSVVNTDLAADASPIVVVVPLMGMSQPSLERELAMLDPARLLVLSADAASSAAMGINPLDPSRRRPAAEAGRRQGGELAAAVRAVWLG